MKNQAMAAKVRALLAKTTENGASEEEAVAAALKARELMDKYDVDMTAEDVRSEQLVEWVWDTCTVEQMEIATETNLWDAVRKFTETEAWESDGRVVYMGLEGDVLFARWLIHTLVKTVESSWDDFSRRLEQRTRTRSRRRAYQFYMANRVADRMYEEIEARARRSTGRELVVTEKAVTIADAVSKMKFTGGGAVNNKVVIHNADAEAARIAAESVRWDRPVEGAGGGARLR